MLKVKCEDNVEFVLYQTVIDQCQTILDFKENAICDKNLILPHIDSATLKLVVAYCEKHAVNLSKIETTMEGTSTTPTSSKISDEELSNWDNNFLAMKKSELYNLIRAAQYLRIDGLLEVSVQKMATMIKKSTEHIRETLKIKSEFTAHDKEELRDNYISLVLN